MSAPNVGGKVPRSDSSSPSDLSAAFADFLEALGKHGTVKLTGLVERGLGDLRGSMLSRGAFETAAYEVGRAHLLGRNRLWAGAKGAWSGATVPQRVAAVVILVLLLVLAPVPLLLLIGGALVAALVAGIKAAQA